MHRLVLLLLLVAPALLHAEGEEAAIRASLEKNLPRFAPDSVSPTAIPGIYEVLIGSQVIYASADGRYVLQGRLLDIVEGQDLTEPAQRKVRRTLIDAVPESSMVIFEAKGEVKHTLTTFTDVDCGYCRKLHAEMDELNAKGIRVRYMLYPRSGLNSKSGAKAVGVWCAKDPLEAMTHAKLGEPVPKASCDNPIAEHMALAQKLGLTGTPYTITDTGERIAGYAPSARLLKRLDESKSALAAN